MISIETVKLRWTESETAGEADSLTYKYRYTPRVINGVLQIRLGRFTAQPYVHNHIPTFEDLGVYSTVELAKSWAQADFTDLLMRHIIAKSVNPPV